MNSSIEALDNVYFGSTSIIFEPVINPRAVCLQKDLYYLESTNTRGHSSDHNPFFYRGNKVPEIKFEVSTNFTWIRNADTDGMRSALRGWFGDQLLEACTEERMELVKLVAKEALVQYAVKDTNELRQKLFQLEETINPKIKEYGNAITRIINCG